MLNWLKNLLGGPKADIGALLKENASIIDVRSPKEFASGHAKGSINIPLGNLGAQMGRIKKLPQPIVTCCRSGQRSGMGAAKLRQQGLEAFNGGSWQNVERLNS